jgi:hypothetical protein
VTVKGSELASQEVLVSSAQGQVSIVMVIIIIIAAPITVVKQEVSV